MTNLSSPLLALLNCSAQRGERVLFSNASAEIGAGQLVYLLGRNGQGKTTLLKCIERLVPFSGQIFVAGKSVLELSRRELALSVGYVPQTYNLTLQHHVADFLGLNAFARQYDASALAAEVRRVAELLDIVPFLQRRVCDLSGGEQQRVMIASSVIGKPRVLLVDEPTSFLDPHHQQVIARLLRRLADEERCAVLTITHVVGAALRYADAMMTLDEGTFAYYANAAAFSKQECERLYRHEFLTVEGAAGAAKLFPVP